MFTCILFINPSINDIKNYVAPTFKTAVKEIFNIFYHCLKIKEKKKKLKPNFYNFQVCKFYKSFLLYLMLLLL